MYNAVNDQNISFVDQMKMSCFITGQKVVLYQWRLQVPDNYGQVIVEIIVKQQAAVMIHCHLLIMMEFLNNVCQGFATIVVLNIQLLVQSFVVSVVLEDSY